MTPIMKDVLYENRRMFTILYCKAALGLQMFSHPTCRDDAPASDSGLDLPFVGKVSERTCLAIRF